MVSCNTSRTFWISWESGLMKLGRGAKVGYDEVLSYSHDNPYGVNSASFSAGWGSSGIWTISQPKGNTLAYYTPAGYNYDLLWIQPTNYFIEFKVKGSQFLLITCIIICEILNFVYFVSLHGRTAPYDNE